MRGPIRAGSNDNGNVAAKGGLKEKLEKIGKMALATRSTMVIQMCASLITCLTMMQSKNSSLGHILRHEKFNGMMKELPCLHYCFRRKEAKFSICFEAAAVICQCRMEIGKPLFYPLAGLKYEVYNAKDEQSESSNNATARDATSILLSSEVPHSHHHPRKSRRSASDYRDRGPIRHIMVGRVWLVHLCLVH